MHVTIFINGLEQLLHLQNMIPKGLEWHGCE